jgi:hypothetical protein
MKRIILIIAAVGLISANIVAQENKSDSQNKLQLGLKIGANYSNVYDSKGEEFNADPKFGITGGAFLRIPLGKFLGFQPELLFSQKGFKASGSILGSAYTFKRTTNFIDIPLLLQIKPSEFITLLAGPQYSYLMKQNDVFTNSILSASQEQEFENGNIRKNILGFLGGFDINIEKFVFGARIGWDISNNNGDGTSASPRYKNVWGQATLGIMF